MNARRSRTRPVHIFQKSRALWEYSKPATRKKNFTVASGTRDLRDGCAVIEWIELSVTDISESGEKIRQRLCLGSDQC